MRDFDRAYDRIGSFASIPRCPSYVRLDSESGGKADIVRGRICAPTTGIGATILSRRALKKTSRLRLGTRTFSDTTPADVEVTENSTGRHTPGIAKKLSDVMNEGLAVPRRMWSRIATSRKRSPA